MPDAFELERSPTRKRHRQIGELDPTNPFWTPEYRQAMEQLGFQSWLILIRGEAGTPEGCPAFLDAGRLRRTLNIPSVPPASGREPFWTAVRRLCESEDVTDLIVGSFGSRRAKLPPAFPGEVERKDRWELVLPLGGNVDLEERLSSNHRRNVQQAVEAGLEVRRRTDVEGLHDHAAAMGSSFQRRDDRGEDVPDGVPLTQARAFLLSGAGELVQAVSKRDGSEKDEVLSSVLLLHAPAGGYYQSAGTTAEGRTCGASHFLLHSIAKMLQDDGKKLFNLGGVDSLDSGLARFKSGFGTESRQLVAARYEMSGMRSKLVRGLKMIRELGDR